MSRSIRWSLAGALAVSALSPMTGTATAAPPVAAFLSLSNPDAPGPGNVVSAQHDGTDDRHTFWVRTVDPDGGTRFQVSLWVDHPEVDEGFGQLANFAPAEAFQNSYNLTYRLGDVFPQYTDGDSVVMRVVLRDASGEETVVDQPAVFDAAAEAVEITGVATPGNTRDQDGVILTANEFHQVNGTASAGATSVELSYSTTPRTGVTPTYTACGTAKVIASVPKRIAGTCNHPGVDTSAVTALAARAVAGNTKGAGSVFVITNQRETGYWMVGSDGKVYPFGGAKPYGNAGTSSAVDLEPTPSGNGYWIVDDQGSVFASGDAVARGNVDRAKLAVGERVTSLSATRTGAGYWVFTTRGRVLTFGDAAFLGDMSGTPLNGPVLDSIPTPSGAGYYMVASDGGIFAFGDAKFYGSMGGAKLNAPVQSLVPDADGVGYWLVASDGGIFSFEADFKGSMGNAPLNRPVTGMVRAGSGYLMVGEDGGIFDFSGTPDGFKGSLGRNPPRNAIASVAVLAN